MSAAVACELDYCGHAIARVSGGASGTGRYAAPGPGTGRADGLRQHRPAAVRRDQRQGVARAVAVSDHGERPLRKVEAIKNQATFSSPGVGLSHVLT
jgi:hypothetical protein